MRFVKMHGIGNDYIYIDAFTDASVEPATDLPRLSQLVAERHTGIGADGLIALCRPKDGGHVRMRMFNADGSESEMCGNGIRCVAKFAHDRLGLRHRPMLVETGRGLLSIEYEVSRVGGREVLTRATVNMGVPVLEAEKIPVALPRPTPDGQVVGMALSDHVDLRDGGSWREACGLVDSMTCVSMGNPHVVMFCDDVARVPLEHVGPIIERHPIFPKRVNAHFVQVVSPREAIMRTWERGSGITMACGTGACAVLVAGALTERLGREALIHLPGGDLTLAWKADGVFKTGPATDVCEGEWLGDPCRVDR